MSKKKMILEVNSNILQILKDNAIPVHDGIAFLLCIYYNLQPSYIPEELVTKIFSIGILNKNYSTNEITWNEDLFEEGEKEFEWVSNWMSLFGNINKERRGVKQDVIKRMKKFFANNPSIRVDDVLKATHRYLQTVSDPKFLKKSHKFIYEGDGSSLLKEWIDRTKEEREINKEFGGLI